MARPRTGSVRTHVRADGTARYSARIMVYGNRETVELGDERDGITKLMAERRLAEVLEEIRLGTWVSSRRGGGGRRRPEPVISDAAVEFLDHKRLSQLRDGTISHLRWTLDTHIVPFFGAKRPSQITDELVERYAAHEVKQRDRIERLRSEGKYLEGPGGGALRAMSNTSINSTLRVLAELLDWAARRGWGRPDDNPAKGYRLKVHKRITFALEPDELADLLAAVASPRVPIAPSARIAARQEAIVRLREQLGLEWIEIGERLGTTASTAHYHYARVKDQESRLDHERAAADSAFVSALAWSGARVTELCDLNVEDVDLAHEKFRIPDSKTPTGVRDVDMTPALMAAVEAHFASRPDLAGDEPAFATGDGRRRTGESANKLVLAPAARLANELRVERGARRLPKVTAHVLRHTYITLAFEAGYSVPYVMQQVGHRDPRTTMSIYAKVCARRDRSAHHAAFDRLLAAGSVDVAASERPALATVA